MRGSSAGGMPGPVSLTSITAESASSRTWTATVPPVAVNFTALPTRLFTSCTTRSRSNRMATVVEGATR